MESQFVRPKFQRYELLGLLAIAAVLASCLVSSWGRWLDPVLDTGRDLYIPEKILEGKKLYRDFQYYYPPAAPYILAAVVAVVGSGLLSYALIGCAIALITAAGLYFTIRTLVGVPAALTGALLFVTCNVTQSTGSNFIFPYAHGTTFGAMFLVLYLLFLFRYIFDGRQARDFAVAIALGILASGCKLEFTGVVGVTLAAAIVIHRPRPKLVIGALAAFGVTFAAADLYFRDAPAGRHWIVDNILLLTSGRSERVYFSILQGTNELVRNARETAVSALFVIAFIAALAAFEGLFRKKTIDARLLLAGVSLALCALTLNATDQLFFRGWAFLQILLIPIAIRKLRSPLPLLLLASLLASWRILLRLSPAWYGFFLMVPIYIFILYVLLRELPEIGVYSRRVGYLWVPMFVLIMLQAQTDQHARWSRSVYPVETPRGTYFDANRDRAEVVREFLRLAAARPLHSLVVIPESPTLNYFVRVDNPLPYQMFTPIVSDDPRIESDMIRAFERTRPQHVAIINRTAEEFGYRGFGVDYDLRLADYITSHYRVANVWQRRGFTMLLAERATTSGERHPDQ